MALPRAVLASCLLHACGARSSDALAGGGVVAADAPCLGATAGPTFLVPGIARGIAVDDAFVYTATNDGIVRAPRAGGAVEKIASSESPVALSADATSLYFFGSHPTGAPDRARSPAVPRSTPCRWRVARRTSSSTVPTVRSCSPTAPTCTGPTPPGSSSSRWPAATAPCRAPSARGNLAVRGGNLYWANATSVALSDPNPPYGIMTACK